MDNTNDIILIRKYLNGELDARAMHELERRAQDDPFLMDALDGYEQAGDSRQVSLNDIKTRLRQRTDKKVRRMIPWAPLSVAASILIILGIGLWIVTSRQPVKQSRIAMAEKPAPVAAGKAMATPPVMPPNDTLADKIKTGRSVAYSKSAANAASYTTPLVSADKSVISAPLSDATQQTLKRYSTDKDTASVNDMLVSDAGSKKKKDSSYYKYQYKALPGKVAGATITSQPSPTNNSDLLKMGIAPANGGGFKNDPVTSRYKPQRDTAGVSGNVVASGYASQRKKDRSAGTASVTPIPVKAENTITGKIVAGDDGQPVIGATVKIVGSTHGVVTDVNGRFVLPNVYGNQVLAIAYVGYNTRHISITNRDSLSIVLQPNTNSLSEVAVVAPKDANVVNEGAHPRSGWQALNTYLKKNAVATDGQTGKVKLSFTVDGNGNLSGFKIIKGLSKAADQKAIDLLQSGTGWVGSSDGTSQQIAITVKFH